jgi:hypothetical protein
VAVIPYDKTGWIESNLRWTAGIVDEGGYRRNEEVEDGKKLFRAFDFRGGETRKGLREAGFAPGPMDKGAVVTGRRGFWVEQTANRRAGGQQQGHRQQKNRGASTKDASRILLAEFELLHDRSSESAG